MLGRKVVLKKNCVCASLRSRCILQMTAELAAVITGAVSVLTLCLSRLRCVVRNSQGRTEWGLGFTENALFPVDPPPAPP